MKQKGKWVKGDYNSLNSEQMRIKFSQAKIGVKLPTAIEEKRNKKGKIVAWRQYHKPIQPGEFWD